MCSVNRMIPRLDLRPGFLRFGLLAPVFCLLAVALSLAPSAARGDVGCEESGLLILENGICAQSGMFAIDNRYARADFNQDGHVDLTDLEVFAGCAARPAVAHNGSQACQDADFDEDVDVDQDDFAAFQRCWSGEGIPADPDCAEW